MNAEKKGEADTMSRCASCGVKEGGDVKLKKCAACYLIKYCGVKCQKEHRPKHKRVCKQRATELRDEILFKQPESSHLGDCPICFLPLPLVQKRSIITNCCGKVICKGCDYANQIRQIKEKQDQTCVFCRQPLAESKAEGDKMLKDRAEMNDPVAMRQYGQECYDNGDYQVAFRYWSNAVELGDVGAHYNLAGMYHFGRGVEKDEPKAMYHNEQAAIGGHADARCNLGIVEWKNGRPERAVKHLIIAAKLGDDESLEWLKKAYKDGLVSKDDLAAALRGHQAAVDATKSPQREEGDAYFFNLP